MNLYEKVYDWLLGYEPLNDWLYFNVTNYEEGCVSLNSVAMSRYLSKDILGNKVVEFVFAIDMIKLYDDQMNSNNLDALQEVNNFADWIEDNGNPDFGSSITIDKIEVMTNVPNMSVDNDNNLAKYQFQVKITYKDESEA